MAQGKHIVTNSTIFILTLVFTNVIVATGNHGNLLPIGKQRLPDPHNIKQLEYSPGGEYFYRQYYLLHQPVVIRNAAKNWPLVEKWKNHDSDEDDELFSQLLPTIQSDSNPKETIRNIIKNKFSVETVLPSNSKLLEEMNIPLILQCHEFMDKLRAVELHVNNHEKSKIQFNDNDEIIVAFDKSFSILIFGSDKLVSGKSLRDANMAAIDVVKFPDAVNVPYQILDINRGDVLYLPKYSWYHIQSASLISLTKIKLDFYAFDFKDERPYMDALDEYKQYLLSQPNVIKCNNTKSTFGHSLNLAIDFDNELATSHLRIPKKNERPEDVVLASGYKMPVLGLGTALLNETTYDAVSHALKYGYRMFDLAHAYPFSETGFSKALADSSVPREDVFVVTKLAPRYLGYEETLFAIDDSLSRLNTSYIDLYLIHAMDCDDFLLTCEEGEPKGTWKESWRAMEYATRIGKIRSIGVSNFYKAELFELLNLSEEPVSVLQNWFDPFNSDKETRAICSKYNIRYMGYSTLGSYWQMLGMDFNPVFASSTITGIAANYDYVVASVVLRWAIHENVTVIPRSANPIHIGQNIRALDLSLLQEELDLINGFDEWMSGVKDGDLNMEMEDISKWVATNERLDIPNSKDEMIESNDGEVKSNDDTRTSNDDDTKLNLAPGEPSVDLNAANDVLSEDNSRTEL